MTSPTDEELIAEAREDARKYFQFGATKTAHTITALADRLEARVVGEAQKPRPCPHAVPPTKYSEYFGFDGGSLTVKTLGYGNADGNGWMCFAEHDPEWEQGEDGKDYRILNLPNSEMIFIRDKLCEVFPLSLPPLRLGEGCRSRGGSKTSPMAGYSATPKRKRSARPKGAETLSSPSTPPSPVGSRKGGGIS